MSSSPRRIAPADAIIEKGHGHASPILLPAKPEQRSDFVTEFNETYAALGWRIDWNEDGTIRWPGKKH
ncbi:hypothetical protein V7x_34750 [Crateriforma conspicua]|uniref:Uncharacterized protein n=1 Tax=Crateriforma conspicua TaxID=2527996 RepID=A0A5C6FML4_9PLAN|nr:MULTISPECIES: hypothetical protein [Crateriforma]TWU61786.1 hypothetical protein V7x_34750 [Crateriforma conspicua]